MKGVVSGAAPAPAAAGGRSPRAADFNLLPWPQVDFAKFGPIESQPLSRIKKISGAEPAPQLGDRSPTSRNFDEADITELEAFRKSSSTRRPRSRASS